MAETTVMVQPLPLDRIDTDGTYYGVKVSPIGEDAEIAVFTHDSRRAVAAVRRLVREQWRGQLLKARVGEPVWWQVSDNCGCGSTCTCLADEAGNVDHDCRHADLGLLPCGDEERRWVGVECTEDAPGAVPVLEIEVDY